MRKSIFWISIILYLTFLSTLVSGAPPRKDDKFMIDQPLIQKYQIKPGIRLFKIPDLIVTIEGPENVAAGDSIPIVVTAANRGGAEAKGSNQYPWNESYYIDIILSKDTNYPIEPAVQPSYNGATKEDFVEDMLVVGGRFSLTESLSHNEEHVYAYSVDIPTNIEPGYYYIAAVIDPFSRIIEINEGNNTHGYMINIFEPRPPGTTVPSGVDFWVMPYAVGNTPINKIKSTGKIDYLDGLSTYIMNDAPFGKRLGFRLGYEQHIPRADLYYYRWMYKRDGDTEWTDFSEPVGVHYVREVGSVVSFPIQWLGPQNVDGKNLYRFKPHNPPDETPDVTYWPTTDWFGDIYSGFLNSHTIPDGKYTIRLELYDNAGVQVVPTGNNKFLVPDGTGPGGTINTRVALPAEVISGGFQFPLFINNTPCSAYVAGPSIGTNTASDHCGFLIYGSGDTDVNIAFDAVHPDGYGYFKFFIKRGIDTPVFVTGEVTATSAGAFNGDSVGHFTNDFSITGLLSPSCPTQAAFSENLHVYAKATTGWNQRINHYDAHFVRAFALSQ